MIDLQLNFETFGSCPTVGGWGSLTRPARIIMQYALVDKGLRRLVEWKNDVWKLDLPVADLLRLCYFMIKDGSAGFTEPTYFER
jgi:hypothetical protein